MIGQRGLGRRVRRDGEDAGPAPPVLSLLDEDEVRERGLDWNGLQQVQCHRSDTMETPHKGEDSAAIPEESVRYYYQPVASVKRPRSSLSPAVVKLTARVNEAKDRLRRLRLLEGQGHEQQDLGELIDKWRDVVEAVLAELIARTGAARRAILRSVGVDGAVPGLAWLAVDEDGEPDRVSEASAESEREEGAQGDGAEE